MKQIINSPESSNIIRAEYDAETKAFDVHFKNGSYRYFGVPQSVVDAYKSSPSKGSFLHRNIKSVYESQKL